MTLVILPIFPMVGIIKDRYKKSPFPEGLDTSKFSREELFVYEELKKFFRSGNFTLKKGFDCDKLFIGDVYFANIAYYNRSIYVNINKDFRRFDNRLDRSGAIRVLTSFDLKSAKDRIYEMYKLYFRQFKREY